MDRNRLMGSNGHLPWQKLVPDMRRFQRLTMGNVVVMGRKTFDSLKKPLEGRLNIVLTHRPCSLSDGCITAYSIAEAIYASEIHRPQKDTYIIGGAKIFEHGLEIAERLYITHIQHTFTGDTWFPKIDGGRFEEIERFALEEDDKTGLKFYFSTYKSITVKT